MVDLLRIGRVVRAVRLRRGWRQKDLALAAGLSVATIGRVEHERSENVELGTLVKATAALEIKLDVRAMWRGADLDRMLNAGHAAMHEQMAALLDGLPAWTWASEVSFSIYGERGVIDVLAFHPDAAMLLIVELKTEFADVGELVGSMDRRRRLGGRIAAERGWQPKAISTWVVVAEGATNRRRLSDHAGMLRHAFPVDGRRMRSWLRQPDGAVNALSFLSHSNSVSSPANGSLPKRASHGGGGATGAQTTPQSDQADTAGAI
jgi:transcriptional regulator with XRE-family HTH domain